jgi:hypothetical protein
MSAPVTRLNVSPKMCGVVASPKPNTSFPGFCLA